MQLPSFVQSTLSLMAFISLLATISFGYMGIEVQDWIQQVLVGIIGAYIGARLPQNPKETTQSV